VLGRCARNLLAIVAALFGRGAAAEAPGVCAVLLAVLELQVQAGVVVRQGKMGVRGFGSVDGVMLQRYHANHTAGLRWETRSRQSYAMCRQLRGDGQRQALNAQAWRHWVGIELGTHALRNTCGAQLGAERVA